MNCNNNNCVLQMLVISYMLGVAWTVVTSLLGIPLFLLLVLILIKNEVTCINLVNYGNYFMSGYTHKFVYSCVVLQIATENMPAESEPPLSNQSIAGRKGFTPKTASVKYLLIRILFECMFSIN